MIIINDITRNTKYARIEGSMGMNGNIKGIVERYKRSM